jgi:hypothetical protein
MGLLEAQPSKEEEESLMMSWTRTFASPAGAAHCAAQVSEGYHEMQVVAQVAE